MTNLYDIASEYKHVLNNLNDLEDIDQETIENTLSPLKDDFNNKAINITSFFRNLEADAEAIKNAEAEMRKRRIAIENKINSMKDYLKSQMVLAGISKISCPYFEVSVSKSKSSVVVLDEGKIPEEFIRTKTIKEPDKKLIYEAGGCDGVEIKETWALKIK